MSTHWTPARITVAGAIGGMVGGVMYAMVVMLYGWASPGHRFWDPPMAIWAYVGGLSHYGDPANHVWPILLGIGGHMMNSMIVGVVIVGILAMLRLRGLTAPTIAAAALGVAVWPLMRYVLLPLNTPEDRLFTTGIVSPQWAWWIGHVALGMGIGMVYALAARRRTIRPAELVRDEKLQSSAA